MSIKRERTEFVPNELALSILVQKTGQDCGLLTDEFDELDDRDQPRFRKYMGEREGIFRVSQGIFPVSEGRGDSSGGR